MHSNAVKQLRFGFFLLLVTMIIGTFGYSLMENWSILDSFYMTVITISTTGFREVKPLSETGRILTVFLIISGVVAIAYTGGRAAQIIIEAQVFRRRRMNKILESLENHYIVCGYGRMGKTICEGLKENNVFFVVVENDPKKIEQLEERNFLFINGDATHDDVLITAGIKRAKGFVAVLRTNAENVFATLSAKELNPEVFLVARAIDDGTESKLLKAGADRVVLPYDLGGNRMVQLLLRPRVIDFIDGVARNKDVDISLEEITVDPTSPLIGKSLADSPIRKDLNIIIVAIYRDDGKFIYNPKSSTTIEKEDKLIAVGEMKDLNKLTELCFKKN